MLDHSANGSVGWGLGQIDHAQALKHRDCFGAVHVQTHPAAGLIGDGSGFLEGGFELGLDVLMAFHTGFHEILVGAGPEDGEIGSGYDLLGGWQVCAE